MPRKLTLLLLSRRNKKFNMVLSGPGNYLVGQKCPNTIHEYASDSDAIYIVEICGICNIRSSYSADYGNGVFGDSLRIASHY